MRLPGRTQPPQETHEGAIYDDSGLVVVDVVAHRDDTGSILDLPGADNAADVQASIVAEATNGPVTTAACS